MLNPILIVAVLISAPAISTTALSICPPPEVDLYPCTCLDQTASGKGAKLSCTNLNLNQSSIDNLLTAVRLANNISFSDPDQWLYLDDFQMLVTRIESLDLRLFKNINVQLFVININPMLTTITPVNNSGPDAFKIRADYVAFEYNDMTDDIMAQILSFIDPVTTRVIDVTGNNFVGSQDGAEFFKGLSTFYPLQHLNLDKNIMDRLGGGQFRNNSRLTSLYVADGQLRELGENSFLFNPPDEDMKNEPLLLFLQGNLLTQQNIHSNLGLDSLGRPFELSLGLIDSDFVSEEIFKKILLADSRNVLRFVQDKKDAGFLCDQRMNWLRQPGRNFEERVHGINCRNDPGQTVCTTELIF